LNLLTAPTGFEACLVDISKKLEGNYSSTCFSILAREIVEFIAQIILNFKHEFLDLQRSNSRSLIPLISTPYFFNFVVSKDQKNLIQFFLDVRDYENSLHEKRSEVGNSIWAKYIVPGIIQTSPEQKNQIKQALSTVKLSAFDNINSETQQKLFLFLDEIREEWMFFDTDDLDEIKELMILPKNRLKVPSIIGTLRASLYSAIFAISSFERSVLQVWNQLKLWPRASTELGSLYVQTNQPPFCHPLPPFSSSACAFGF
jgi:hypothetical protein